MTKSILFLIASILLLWFGAKYLVESSERIAIKFGVSELIIGLTIVAFGTSAPEFAVTINAALFENSNISVGNIVGSNIFNIGFILGIVAIIATVKTTKKLVFRDGAFMLFSALLLLFFFRDNSLNKYEGITLFVLLILYILFLFIKKEAPDEEIETSPATWKDFLITPASLAMIILGGNLLVNSASNIARALGMSEWLIAITVVAAGTSAPEMVTSIVAVVKGKHGISAGNLIGSNIFNILGVLGTAGFISANPLVIDDKAFISLIMLCAMIFIVLVFMKIRYRVSRVEGILLVLIGLSLWITDFIRFYQ